ncbi:uncharacterized protein SCHCODRAFT_02577300 [Schizophyllum commune H4-8]|nr:uncharacterized protein SCHCODRAFT_02577300 [Schizophyllum commune H4-8]KAI5894338.1 hypothetical protein SCHCODRAFT_02577300 [Schizophyllum commune H4-8]
MYARSSTEYPRRMSAGAYAAAPRPGGFVPHGGISSPYGSVPRPGDLPPSSVGSSIAPGTPRASSAPDALDYPINIPGSPDTRINALATLLAEERTRADAAREDALMLREEVMALKAALRDRDMEIVDLRRELATASSAARVFEARANEAEAGAARLADRLPLRDVPPGTLPPSPPMNGMQRNGPQPMPSMTAPGPIPAPAPIPAPLVSPTPLRPMRSLDAVVDTPIPPPAGPGLVATPAAGNRAPVLENAPAPPGRIPTAVMDTLPPGFVPHQPAGSGAGVVINIPSPGSSRSSTSPVTPDFATPLSPLSTPSEVTSDDIMIYPRTTSAAMNTVPLPGVKNPYDPGLPSMMSQLRV